MIDLGARLNGFLSQIIGIPTEYCLTGIPPYIHQASLRPDRVHTTRYRSRNTVNVALLEYRVT